LRKREIEVLVMNFARLAVDLGNSVAEFKFRVGRRNLAFSNKIFCQSVENTSVFGNNGIDSFFRVEYIVDVNETIFFEMLFLFRCKRRQNKTPNAAKYLTLI